MFNDENKIFEEILNDVINKFLIPKHKSLGQEASGKWIKSLEAKGNVIRGEKYTEQLVYGRKPNKKDSHEEKAKWAYGMANFNPEFMKWLQIRGLKQYGMQIAYSIADKGTEDYRKGGTDLLEVLETKEVIDFINDALGKYYTSEMELEIKRQIQTL